MGKGFEVTQVIYVRLDVLWRALLFIPAVTAPYVDPHATISRSPIRIAGWNDVRNVLSDALNFGGAQIRTIFSWFSGS